MSQVYNSLIDNKFTEEEQDLMYLIGSHTKEDYEEISSKIDLNDYTQADVNQAIEYHDLIDDDDRSSFYLILERLEEMYYIDKDELLLDLAEYRFGVSEKEKGKLSDFIHRFVDKDALTSIICSDDYIKNEKDSTYLYVAPINY